MQSLFIFVKELRHSPEKILAGAYGPSHLDEWAPF
jgi:hypothetical protein